MEERYKVVVDLEYGYHRLEPLPTAEEVENFYRDQYYEVVRARRGWSNDEKKAKLDAVWMEETLWKDIQTLLERHVPNDHTRSLLDIGCGHGRFGHYMSTLGWNVVGVEPSNDAAGHARSLGLKVYASIQECFRNTPPFDAVTLLNVLEHVIDPIDLLRGIRDRLRAHGILVVRVPNDFSVLQKVAQERLNRKPWWIAIPDHLNYFNYKSLLRVLEKLEFRVFDIMSDFPMEMFLLFGDDYIGDQELGRICHKKRVNFELSLPAELRRNLYRSFANLGIGRNCLVFAKIMAK